jgi:protoheme IX farnesyltransferase
VRGDEATAWNILAYAASLLPLTLLLFIIGGLGYVYLAVAIILGCLFIAYAFRLLRSGAASRRAMARAVYLYSLLYLALLFVAIMVDSTLRL